VTFVSIQKDLLDKRTDETGDWILDSEEFKKWLESPHGRVLWCPGMRESYSSNPSAVINVLIAGVGKTVLT
jgi:hypothetical protein